MEEKQFIKELRELNENRQLNYSMDLDKEGIETPIYFYVNDKGNVVLDVEGMIEEFNNKLNLIKEVLKIK